MTKMNPVVHFEMPYENRERLVKFFTEAFGWQMQKLGKDTVITSLQPPQKVMENRMVKRKGAINEGFVPKKPDWLAQYPSVVIAVDKIKKPMKKVADASGKSSWRPIEIQGSGNMFHS